MQNKIRRNGLLIMFSLIKLLGSFSFIMILAVINEVLGFILAMGVTIFGALGIAKVLGANIFLTYEVIISLAIVCGLLRGVLRYLSNILTII